MAPEQHSQAVARMVDAFNVRDHEGWMAGCTDDVEVESRFSRVGGATYRGRAGVDAWWADLAEAWNPITVELEASADVGPDRTVVLLTLHGRGRESGLELEEPVALRWHWERDRLRQMEYMDRAEAELIVRASS